MGNMIKTYLHKFNLILLTWVDRSLFIGLGEKNLCHRDWIIGRETLVVKTCFQCKCDKGISIDSALIWKERFWRVLEKAVHEVLTYHEGSTSYNESKKGNLENEFLGTTGVFKGEGNGTPLQYSCLGYPMDGGAWEATVHEVTGSRTRLSNFTFTFHFHALEKEMATHSSVLAWRIPGTEEPGGLPSMGSHRVGHDWRDLAAAAAGVFKNCSIVSYIILPITTPKKVEGELSSDLGMT